jgi:hypothetical protein
MSVLIDAATPEQNSHIENKLQWSAVDNDVSWIYSLGLNADAIIVHEDFYIGETPTNALIEGTVITETDSETYLVQEAMITGTESVEIYNTFTEAETFEEAIIDAEALVNVFIYEQNSIFTTEDLIKIPRIIALKERGYSDESVQQKLNLRENELRTQMQKYNDIIERAKWTANNMSTE